MTFDLLLVGFGNVARRFVSLLDEQQDRLAREHDIRTRIVGVTTRRHGQRYAARGLDAPALARAIERGESVGQEQAGSVAFIRRSTAHSAVAARQRRLVVMEATTLDIHRGEPAIAHVRAALAGGAHVVTANKGPAAFAYRSLARAASKANRRFLFEGAVMDGIPIFNLVRETLPAVTVTGFRGVVNSTTNYVLTAMERGETFETALARMQAAGIAEAEPSLDIMGWDAAAKTAALANVLLEANLTPHDVARQPLSAAMGRQAIAAVTAGRRLKFVAEASRDGRRVSARVASVELPADDLLASLEGQQNAIVLTTDLLEEVAIVQRGGGLTHTAYALLSDLVTIGRDVSGTAVDDNHILQMPPLDGTTVVDLTRVLSGPYCTMLLADMGARVIKVEQPGKGDDTRAWGPPFLEGESAYFLSINRNKESITLDFKQPEGRAVLEALIARSDVLVENFRPGTLAKVGLDYRSLATRHPTLVYCSVSGFGQSGPRSHQAGYDAVMQAEGGLMSITGAADGQPYRLGVAIADIVSGMFAAYGIAMALLARQRSGKGQEVDVAMLDAVTALLTYQAGNFFASGKVPARLGNRHPSIVPYETFAAADGDFVLAVGNDDQWRRFCAVAELPVDDRFATNRQRVTAYDEFRPYVADRLKTRPRSYWIDRLTAAGVPCGSVRDFSEVFADPQLAAREMIAEVDHSTIGALKLLGVPVKLSETPGSIRTAPPRLGEHTDAILSHDLGYSADAIAGLRRQNVV